MYIHVHLCNMYTICNINDDLPIQSLITGSLDHWILVAEDRLAFAYGSNWEAVTARR